MPPPRSARRTLLWWSLWMAVGTGVLVLVCNAWLLWRARGRTVTSAAALRSQDVGLVLGTAPLIGTRPNRFFEARMDAAAQAYRAGKVRHLLLSGDNGRRGYDEPTAMKGALLARGLPASALHLDYAGFRTLDSMARARLVFGLQDVTIITDDFHLPRSLFLADAFGLSASGLASHVPVRLAKKTLVREIGSRVAAVIDVYLLHRKPKFYGPPVDLLHEASGG